MIRREYDDAWLLISQVDHAHLAADLAAAWGNDEVTPLPLAEWLLPAIRDHDAGWRRWEAAPTLNSDGMPRAFTEMSDAAEVTAIWSESIATCASGFSSLADALRRLRSDGGEVSPDDAAVLDAIVSYRDFVPAARLKAELLRETESAESAIEASLRRLETKSLIRENNQRLGGAGYTIELQRHGASPLGGLWVSRHFSALATQACESGHLDETSAVPLRGFLREQAELQSQWLARAKDFAGEELDRIADTGFRYVQFFDRISLWLCMADRDEPWEATLSSKLSLRFTPLNSREFTVDPWPFAAPAVELSVPAIALEAAPLTSDAALRHAVANGDSESLRWVLSRE